ncbi:hypothetical protein AX16_006130 [Volvariella volvacea WC 439]|nr:hypothetical protein AX16_006130 [Volvariella volvacea WC 439]
MNQIHQELDVYKALANGAQDHNCSTLIDYFDVSDAINKNGMHLCLVTDLLHCTAFDIARELRRGGQSFSLPVMKLILRDILKAVSFLHSHGMAHTSISPKAVGIVVDSDLDIDNWLKPNLGAAIKFIAFDHQITSQPLAQTFQLVAQFLNSKNLNLFETTPLTVQPLKMRLCLDWNQTVDIWGIGLLAYYLLTLKPLFSEHGPPEFFDAVWIHPHLSVLGGSKRYPGQDTGAYTNFLTLLYCAQDDTLLQAMIEACERIIEFYGNDLALYACSSLSCTY